ncbi:MAG: hypothetical protein J6U23_03615, partial [Clostridiales bacterium]|nr:hypothetical protein [Clostridiales bacterium]
SAFGEMKTKAPAKTKEAITVDTAFRSLFLIFLPSLAHKNITITYSNSTVFYHGFDKRMFQ